MAAMGNTGMPMPPDPSMMMGDPMMDPAMSAMPGQMPPMPMPADPMMMDPGGPVPPPTATPLGGAGAASSAAVDLGGMGTPPIAAPDQEDLILTALQAVLGKWASGQATIAGEQNSLLQTLMLLASSQPPTASEAFVEGGAPTNFGMRPNDVELPGSEAVPPMGF